MSPWPDSDSLGKAVLIESTIRMTQALERLRHFSVWTWDDFDEFVTVGVWEDTRARNFFALSRKAKAKGIPAPCKIPNLDVELRMALSTSFHVVDHAGGLTGVGSMVFSPDDGFRPWRIYNPSILTANYQTEGNFGRISGLPGTGKTNTACVISEQWASEPNHVAVGNIRMLEPDPRFIYTPDAKSFFATIANIPYGIQWLFTLDEGGLVYSKPDQATRRVKDLDKFARTIRKLGGSFNLIEQREDSIPNLMMEFAKNVFFCEKQGTVSIELRGPELSFRDTVRYFPKTTLPFDTRDIAMFPINVDVQSIFSVISGSDDPKKTLRQFLEVEDAPVKAYLEKVCAYPGCGKSLVGMSPTAKYCSSKEPPYHAVLGFKMKQRLRVAEILAERDRKMNPDEDADGSP